MLYRVAVRILFVAVVMVLGCEGKQPASSPAPPRKDAAHALDARVEIDAAVPANPTAGTGEPARRRHAFELREAALPQRIPCGDSCYAMHPSPAVDACYRQAQEHNNMAGTAKIRLVGERSKGPCIPKSVEIDCCPSLEPTDYKGIAKRLGWEKANAEERKAIAWVIARVVVGGSIIDEDTVSRPAEGITTMPAARDHAGGVVLDYWIVPEGSTRALFIHEQLTFRASGDLTIKVLGREELVSP
jgi:hypothetical protein